jgi:hypothetical protein
MLLWVFFIVQTVIFISLTFANVYIEGFSVSNYYIASLMLFYCAINIYSFALRKEKTGKVKIFFAMILAMFCGISYVYIGNAVKNGESISVKNSMYTVHLDESGILRTIQHTKEISSDYNYLIGYHNQYAPSSKVLAAIDPAELAPIYALQNFATKDGLSLSQLKNIQQDYDAGIESYERLMSDLKLKIDTLNSVSVSHQAKLREQGESLYAAYIHDEKLSELNTLYGYLSNMKRVKLSHVYKNLSFYYYAEIVLFCLMYFNFALVLSCIVFSFIFIFARKPEDDTIEGKTV